MGANKGKTVDACFFNHFFWELISILSLTFFGIFWTLEHVMVQKFPMTKLLALAMAIAAGFVIWVKIELRVPPYHLDAVVDLLLAAVMAAIAIHVFALLLRASLMPVPASVEYWMVGLVFSLACFYGVYLFAAGSTVQFFELSAAVNYALRLFWGVVVVAVIMRLLLSRAHA